MRIAKLGIPRVHEQARCLSYMFFSPDRPSLKGLARKKARHHLVPSLLRIFAKSLLRLRNMPLRFP